MTNSIKLGAVQAQIMAVLWDRGEATAKDITDSLSQHEPVAHSTVQTLLRQLERKGAIAHEAQGRTFVFKPLIGREEQVQSPIDRMLDRLYGGSLVGLVAHFLDREQVSPEELRQLKKLIDAHEEKEEGK